MRWIILFVFGVTTFFVNAQQYQQLRDSINKYEFLNPNLAIEYGLEYVQLRAEDPPDIEMVKIYSRIGQILLYMELYSSSLEYFNSAMRLRASIKDIKDPEYLLSQSPWVVLNIGNIYYLNKNFPKAKEKFLEAKVLFEKSKDIDFKDSQIGLNTTLANIGMVYGAEGNFEKQEELFFQVFEST